VTQIPTNEPVKPATDDVTDSTTRLALAEQRARIATAAAGAMLVAGVLLMATILPAEYGVDPLGTGKLLGLTSLAQANEPTGGEAPSAEGEVPQSLEPVRPGANTAQTVALKQDTVTFKLGPREGMEYKYRMEKGASFVYSWTSTGRVNFDFHGEPQGAPKGYAESYQMGEGERASGSFFAPTPGIHGWFWENLTDKDITVTLTSTGFYASGIEFSASGQTPHDLPDRK
jgi:hypothetical protein